MCKLHGLLEVKINNKTIYCKDKNNSYEEYINSFLNPFVIMNLFGIDISNLNSDEILSLKNDLIEQLELLSYKYRK